jgi:hypothetical protein
MRLPQLLLGVSHSHYHQDDCGTDTPTLSRSVAEVLLSQSPAHAYACHPKLGGKGGKLATKAMDKGTFLHDRFLGGGPEIVIVDAPDWRKRKEPAAGFTVADPGPTRDEAVAAGKLVMLPKELAQRTREEDSLRKLVLSHPAMVNFDKMAKEAVVVWADELGVVWRCRLDLFWQSHGVSWDLKFTESASEDAIDRAMRWGSHGLQCAVYESAMSALTPELVGRNELHFLFAEFGGLGCRAARPGPGKLQVAEDQRKRASKIWKKCLESGEWPGYPEQELIVEASSFEIQREMDRQIAEAGEPAWMAKEEP